MSYILDALKKSEQERQCGRVPDIGAVQISPGGIQPRPARWPYLLAFGVSLNAVVFLWWAAPWQEKKPTPPPEVRVVERIITVPAAPSPAPVVNGPLPVATPTPVQAPIPAPVPLTSPIPVQPPRNPKRSEAAEQTITPPPPAAIASPSRETKPAHDDAAVRIEPMPLPLPNPQESKAQNTAIVLPAPSAGHNPVEEVLGQYENLLEGKNEKGAGSSARGKNIFKEEPSAEPDSQGFPDVVDTRRIPSQVSRMQKEEVRVALSKMNKQKGGERLDVLDLLQLSPELRKQIPPITISLHLYSQTPTSRKVSINGKIRREGDLLADDLKVDEIVKDGVILRYKEQRFHMAVF